VNYQVIKKQEIAEMPSRYRASLVNSLSGIKGGHLLGTSNKEGQTNLAIFNSIVHIGANPPLMGFILRPTTVERHSWANIQATNCFTLNLIKSNFVEKAHQTSAKYSAEVSEFEAVGLTPLFVENMEAPFVKESAIGIGLRFKERIPIPLNGTSLVIGEIEFVRIGEDLILTDGMLDLEKANTISIQGLNTYYAPNKIGQFPYAKP